MPPTPSLKILIVANELIIAADVSVQLSKLGCEVLGIHTRAADTLQTIATNCPDILLLDLGLPDNDHGLTAARQIANHYQIPFVFLSSNTEAASLEGALALRPLAIIVKPFASEDLENALEHTLARMAQPLRIADEQAYCILFSGGDGYRLTAPPPLEG